MSWRFLEKKCSIHIDFYCLFDCNFISCFIWDVSRPLSWHYAKLHSLETGGNSFSLSLFSRVYCVLHWLIYSFYFIAIVLKKVSSLGFESKHYTVLLPSENIEICVVYDDCVNTYIFVCNFEEEKWTTLTW